MRCRSGPVVDRAYLRVSAFGAYVRVLSSLSVTPEAISMFSYNTHYKATLFRASGPGRGGFSVGLRLSEAVYGFCSASLRRVCRVREESSATAWPWCYFFFLRRTVLLLKQLQELP